MVTAVKGRRRAPSRLPPIFSPRCPRRCPMRPTSPAGGTERTPPDDSSAGIDRPVSGGRGWPSRHHANMTRTATTTMYTARASSISDCLWSSDCVCPTESSGVLESFRRLRRRFRVTSTSPVSAQGDAMECCLLDRRLRPHREGPLASAGGCSETGPPRMFFGGGQDLGTWGQVGCAAGARPLADRLRRTNRHSPIFPSG